MNEIIYTPDEETKQVICQAMEIYDMTGQEFLEEAVNSFIESNLRKIDETTFILENL